MSRIRVAEWAVDHAVTGLLEEFDRVARVNDLDSKTIVDVIRRRVGDDIADAYQEWISESWE